MSDLTVRISVDGLDREDAARLLSELVDRLRHTDSNSLHTTVAERPFLRDHHGELVGSWSVSA